MQWWRWFLTLEFGFCIAHHISRWKLAPMMSPNSLEQTGGAILIKIFNLLIRRANNSRRIKLSSKTHNIKVWFHIGFRVCFFTSVWKILSSDAASFTTDLDGLALDRRVRLSSSSSSIVKRQYGSLKPDMQQSHTITCWLKTDQRLHHRSTSAAESYCWALPPKTTERW